MGKTATRAAFEAMEASKVCNCLQLETQGGGGRGNLGSGRPKWGGVRRGKKRNLYIINVRRNEASSAASDFQKILGSGRPKMRGERCLKCVTVYNWMAKAATTAAF